MANPLRSEGEAFRFLLGALVYFGLIAIAGGILFVYVMLQAIVRGRRTGA